MKLCIFVTHPVQYHVPLWRALSQHPSLSVKVFYFSDHSVRGAIDVGFGVPVSWDVDLLSGYEHEFITRNSALNAPHTVRLSDTRALLARERPDWVWLSGYIHRFEQQLAWWGRGAGARLIMRAEFSDSSHGPRSLPKSALRDVYLRTFYSRIDRFCYPGAAALRHLTRLGVPSARCFFSPYSVDERLIDEAKAAGMRDETRASLGLEESSFTLLFSGKLIPRKAPQTLLDAIRKSHLRDQLSLVVLGDGELRAQFEAEARALLGERLIMPGFVNQSQLGRYFVAADALVMPSEQETWGLVVNEAMHYGLPVLTSSAVGCHHDLVREGLTGFVHPVGDSAALAQHIDRLAADRAQAKRMGIEAERIVAGYRVEDAALGVFRALGLPDLHSGPTPALAHDSDLGVLASSAGPHYLRRP